MSKRRKDSLAAGKPHGPSADGAAPASEPQSLGDFELRREIGRGGMGTVYEAWQHSLQRLVAVKVLSRQVGASSTAVVRFEREAQAAAKLHHAHIVPIFGAGEVGGVRFYAMELVDGPGLNTVIDATRAPSDDSSSIDVAETLPLDPTPVTSKHEAGGPSVARSARPSPGQDTTQRLVPGGASSAHYEQVARHIATIADALDYAHRQGVIHRDIKPHNLILGSDGKMRISDFGLARLSEQPGVTITGEMLGSPLYMSPEQITGGPATVDHRTDVYSLGATMYEWLTSSAPYPGETREQVISKILTTEPLPLRAHDPAIPVDLETICLKAIEREADHRYQTAAELRDDLFRFLEKKPIRARRAGLVTRAWKLIARHRLVSLGAAAAIVAMVLSWALFSAKQQVRTQTAAAEQAVEEREKIEDLLSLLPLELGGPLRLAEAARPMIEGVVAGQKGRVGKDKASAEGDSVDVASVSTPAGIAVRAARDLFRTSMPPDPKPIGDVEADGTSRLLTQALDESEADPALAEKLVAEVLTARPNHVLARELWASLLARLGRFGEMLTDTEAIMGLEPDAAQSHLWSALAHILVGDAKKALEEVSRASALGDAAPWDSALRGVALAMSERHVDAIASFDASLETDPDLVVPLLGRAGSSAALGDLDGAVTDLSRVIEQEPDNVNVLALRGDYHVRLQDYPSAERDYDRAMTIGGRTPAIVLRYLLARRGLRAAPGSSPGS